ncbi:MAG: DUF2993 domain-containing protein [Armatimonadetes bacterium]|nr:DUF2993 domain-containing protein [Armatimonadota bacterium]MCX7968627.1 DUF2993 domain-containing protein [Armatimonadota bacterium]MDW8142296.1 DUF2993 domain-containing protein [Armatimonadota bacterium]
MEKVAVGVALLLLLFFTQVTPDRVERELEKAMRQSLTAKSIDVELEGSPGFPTLKGKFKKMTVKIEGLSFAGGELLEMLPIRFVDKPKKEGRVGEVVLMLNDANYEGLTISELQAQAKTVRFDLESSLKERRLVLVSAASGTLSGFIAANSIQRYLAEHAKKYEVEDVKVRLRVGSVEFEGRWRVELAGVPVLRVPFEAVAELFPTNNEIHWKLVQATVAEIVPLPAGWLQERFKQLNPLIRFDLAPLQVQLQTVSVTPKGLHLTAKFALSP